MSAVVLLSTTGAFGQRFSYGVVAGTALTDDFNSFYLPFSQGLATIEKSGGKGVIVGPMVEWNFSQRFSFEADGLFRELRFEDAFAGPHNPTVTWEFPILAKYRLFSYGAVRSSLRPFVEAGPSFRTTGNLNANPSHAGISAGGGLDLRLRQLNIAPTLRYTRWAGDSSPYGIRSRPDQIELLVGFSHSSGSDARPFGERLSVGAVLGSNLLGDYNATSSTSTDLLSGTQTTFSSRSGRRSFLMGPAVEFRLTGDFSLEADAIYRPVREHYTSTGVSLGQPHTQSGDVSFVTWQFPMVAKYKLPLPFMGNMLRPFVEAGPSFRISGSVTHFGFTAGAGVSAHLGALNIGPAVRYTRWQADPLGQMRANEANLLVGITF
ncbi:MAG: hypothetical protein ACR2JB_21235 [Bryobacteraceae bacterium]